MQSISLAVMVRDDADRLKRCIESARDAVDEIVVLDTGSKDDTIDVARALGARVEEAVWDGSFSSGLNKLLPLIKTDWTLRLDSDEWFEEDPSRALKKATANPKVYGYRIVRRDLLPDKRFREISIFRLWRTSSELRYEGLVHENISNESISRAFPNLLVDSIPLWIWHDGYADADNKKLERNIKLLEEELALRPDQPYYRAMRAVMYRDLEDPRALESLESVADEALRESNPSTKMYAAAFAALLHATPESEIHSQRIDQVIERSWKWFPNYPAIVWAIGLAETKRGTMDRALQTYLKLEQLAEAKTYDTSLSFDPGILGAYLWHAMGFAASRTGRMDIAQRCAGRIQSLRQ